VTLGNNIILDLKSPKISAGNKTYDIFCSPQKKDGIMYLPLRAIVEKGMSKTVKIITKEDCSYLGAKNEKAEHETVIKLDKKIKAPVQKGDLAGSLVVNVNGKEFKTIDLICAQTIEKVTYGYVLRELLTDWLC
jgi:D-alanyl-D-alanine carboxypeptidase